MVTVGVCRELIDLSATFYFYISVLGAVRVPQVAVHTGHALPDWTRLSARRNVTDGVDPVRVEDAAISAVSARPPCRAAAR